MLGNNMGYIHKYINKYGKDNFFGNKRIVRDCQPRRFALRLPAPHVLPLGKNSRHKLFVKMVTVSFALWVSLNLPAKAQDSFQDQLKNPAPK